MNYHNKQTNFTLYFLWRNNILFIIQLTMRALINGDVIILMVLDTVPELIRTHLRTVEATRLLHILLA